MQLPELPAAASRKYGSPGAMVMDTLAAPGRSDSSENASRKWLDMMTHRLTCGNFLQGVWEKG